ncbi:MAG: hypothetical protein GY811_20440 [Myxococcales bacterium]|nr:hypothetical protein [Myxococcales bacterium]
MRILLLCLLAFATTFTAPSCKTADKPGAALNAPKTKASPLPSASRPISIPGAIVATVHLPTGAKMEGLAKAIDNIRPGASAMIAAGVPMALGQALGMDLSAADLEAPIAAIVLSPKNYEKPLALLVSPRDTSALEAAAKAAGLEVISKNGLALVGAANVLEVVSKTAFESLARPPSSMKARVYPEALMKSYKDDVHTAIEEMGSLMSEQQGATGTGFRTLMLAYEEMIMAIGEQTEFVELGIGASDGASDLFFRMRPRSGTTMASLAAAQVASTHDLLGKLPADSTSSILFSGDLRAGKARQPMIDFWGKMMKAIMPAADGDELAKMMGSWFASFDGNAAGTMVMDMSNPLAPKFGATYLWGSTDALAMRKGWRDMMTLMVARAKEGSVNIMGMKFDVEFEEKAQTVDGVEVDRYRSKMIVDHLSADAQQAMVAAQTTQDMHMAAFDNVAVMVMSNESEAPVSDAIAAARGKGPSYKLSGALLAAIERSKSLKESMVFAMDVSALVPPEVPMPFKLFTMGFGQDAGDLTMRMSVRQ